MQLIPLFCFVYSVFSFLVLALAPTFDPANIQITSNFLELLFISCLGMMMWLELFFYFWDDIANKESFTIDLND